MLNIRRCIVFNVRDVRLNFTVQSNLFVRCAPVVIFVSGGNCMLCVYVSFCRLAVENVYEDDQTETDLGISERYSASNGTFFYTS